MAIEDVQTNLRIPSNLKEQLQASADAAGRSLSAEAAHRLAISYELEKVTSDLHGAVASLQSQYTAARNQVDQVSVKLRNTEREMARLEERLETLQASREADIAAAVNHFSERADLLAEKASLFEREASVQRAMAESLERMNRLLGLFLQEVAGMVPKKTETGKEMMRLLTAVGGAVNTGNYRNAIAAAAGLVDMAKQHDLLDPDDKTTHTPASVSKRRKKKPGLLD